MELKRVYYEDIDNSKLFPKSTQTFIKTKH